MEGRDILKPTSGPCLFLTKTIPFCLRLNKPPSMNKQGNENHDLCGFVNAVFNHMKAFHGLFWANQFSCVTISRQQFRHALFRERVFCFQGRLSLEENEIRL